MADAPPPPPPSTPEPYPERPAPATRPGVVTAAAVLLIIGGVLAVLGGLILLVGSSLGAGFAILAVIYLGVGAVQIYAGVQVLNLREQGRIIGIALAAIAALLSLIFITRAPASSIIGIAVDAFIIYALVQNASYFRR